MRGPLTSRLARSCTRLRWLALGGGGAARCRGGVAAQRRLERRPITPYPPAQTTGISVALYTPGYRTGPWRARPYLGAGAAGPGEREPQRCEHCTHSATFDGAAVPVVPLIWIVVAVPGGGAPPF